MELEKRIHEIATNLCQDYPDIEKCDAFEQLWAIEQSHIGTNMACDYLHKILKKFQAKCGMPDDEFLEFVRDEDKFK